MRTVSCVERTSSCARHWRICLPSADNTTTIRAGGARAPREMMMSFIDEHRGRDGAGPMCAQVPRAPSTSYEPKAREGEPERAPGRVRRDEWLCGEIRRVYAEHFGVYGVRKVWRPLRREGVAVARCPPATESHRGVVRLMRRLGLRGAVRGRRAKTTHAVVHGERPDDRVNREFQVSRPNALWVWTPDSITRGQALCGDVAGGGSVRNSVFGPSWRECQKFRVWAVLAGPSRPDRTWSL